MNPVAYAILGCGNIAARHAEALAGLAEARLVAVCDLDRRRAEALGERYGAEVLPDGGGLAAHPEVECVLVSVPGPHHAAAALPLVRAGKHVLVEKPLDGDPERARALVRAAREKGVYLSVVSQHRFHPDVQWLRGLLREGRLGRPVLVQVLSLWRRDQAYYEAAPGRGLTDPREGGVLLNQAVHAVDLLLWLCGPARRIHAATATLTHRIAVEDTAVVGAELANGALAALLASTAVHTQTTERLEVRGEKGTVLWQAGRVEAVEGDVPPPPSRGRPAPDKVTPFREQHRDFCRALREGRPPLVRPEEALAVVTFLAAAYRAAREGRPVDLC